MDIHSTKLELLKTVMNSEDDEFIQKIADFVEREKSDFWNKLSPAEQKEIKQGIGELNNGKRVLYDSFLSKIP